MSDTEVLKKQNEAMWEKNLSLFVVDSSWLVDYNFSTRRS